MGMSHGYQLGTQRQEWNANAAAEAIKNPVCKHRSQSTPPAHPHSWEPVQPATAKVLWSRDNFPRRTHDVPQAVAMSQRPLSPQARPAFQLWLLYPSLPLTWVSKSALISCCFNRLLSGRGTDAWGQPTHRSRAKSKAEPQELCEQRREKEISPCSLRSSRLNPHNQLDVPCTCGIPE